MSKTKLPPLDLKEDQQRFEALSEEKEIEFKGCTHSGIKFRNGELRCACGVGYTGERLDELYRLLLDRK